MQIPWKNHSFFGCFDNFEQYFKRRKMTPEELKEFVEQCETKCKVSLMCNCNSSLNHVWITSNRLSESRLNLFWGSLKHDKYNYKRWQQLFEWSLKNSNNNNLTTSKTAMLRVSGSKMPEMTMLTIWGNRIFRTFWDVWMVRSGIDENKVNQVPILISHNWNKRNM